MSKIKQPKIHLDIDKTNHRQLIRQRDQLTKKGNIQFLEFNEDNRGTKLHDTPKEGYACTVGIFLNMYEWMTSPITEVISDTEFKTNNSHYKIQDND